MLAQDGHTYAVIQDEKVHWIFTKAELPEWADDYPVVDITDVVPMPEERWNYVDGVFSPPA